MTNTVSLEKNLYQLYLEIVTNDPKPEEMSKSLYLTCAAIRINEQLGNKFPTQWEIDLVEARLKCYSRRKSSLKKVA